jgi:hypothetical protein
MPNRLATQKSPYLLQHAENPVDWYPWGDEAFRKAIEEDKPVFLSIGYSTCHWCHVMEHESFEDPQVADLLNGHFVAIKVDREERPDIDQVYMTVCQATTGSGGWPLSIFMAPDKKPFFAGSYFPKTGRFGMPGFLDILQQLAALWKGRRGQLDRISEEIIHAIQPKPSSGESQPLGIEVIESAHLELRKSYDPVWGGFGTAPKFPAPHNLNLLLRWHQRNPGSGALATVEKTLDSMRSGGIFDQIGFGFHRYSVDEKWLVPHFEKMLYDQAMLALAYTDAYLYTGNDRYASVVREIFDYTAREMKSPEGGFYCAEDADSEGREGVFYTWTPNEISDVVGKSSGEIFCRAFGITDRGNFEEDRSIPHISKPFQDTAAELKMSLTELEDLIRDCRGKIFAAREKRVHPLKDDKILVSWNGLMIAALARGCQALGEDACSRSATEAADFILDAMRPGGRLHRRYRKGEIAHPAYADDYAFLIWGLLDLYETVFEIRYLEEAIRLQEQMTKLFEDRSEGGFFFSGLDSENMIVREKVIYDGAVPSSNSVAALNLLRLGRMTGDAAWEEQASLLINSFATQVRLFPPAYTCFLQAVDFSVGPVREIVIAGSPPAAQTKQMIDSVHRLYLPNRVVLLKGDEPESARLTRLAAYTASMHAGNNGPAAFVCEKYRCGKPALTVEELQLILRD